MKNSVKKKPRRRLRMIPLYIVILLTVIGFAVSLVLAVESSVSSSVYSERKELLGSLTESSAANINDNIGHSIHRAYDLAEDAVSSMSRYTDISDYFSDFNQRVAYSDLLYFFVDENGKYYSSDGAYGKIGDPSYYAPEEGEEALTYISTLPHLGSETSYLIFRNRLSTPVTLNTPYGNVTLTYSGFLYDIGELNAEVSLNFSGANNTFIYDDTNGAMLYKHFGIEMLLDGYNIYPKFETAARTYGEDPAQLRAACQSHSVVVVSLNIRGTEYYFCSAPLEHESWSLAFIIQANYLDDATGNAFRQVINYIILIAAVLGSTIIAIFVITYKNLVSARSLEEISALNGELEQANLAKSDFLSNMSHDIRTPINGIMGMTAIARGVEGNPEKTRVCLEKIDGASRHLLSLINDVLDMSRIERGKTEIAANPIDIRTVFDNCAGIIKGQIGSRTLNFITEVECEHPQIFGDDLHLRQILINILSNAVKFTKDGGSIRFTLLEKECADDRVVFSFTVSDTGIGMRPEYLTKIFDAFTQDQGGARSEYKGTGLGMAITKQLTDLMGGTIEVESTLDVGSTFTVTIPFAVNTATPVEAEPEEEAEDLHGIRILLVEDNELNTDIATELLEDAGAEITSVENGALALESFRDHEPGTYDVILMDVMMPVMNGIEASKAIRAMSRTDAQTIPIIAMTANAFESDVKATREAGMDAHLSKPINIEEVIRTVARFVRKGRSAQ